MNCLWFAWVNEYEIENPAMAINCILNKTKPKFLSQSLSILSLLTIFLSKLQGTWPKL